MNQNGQISVRRLVLGTAQLGMHYGIANRTGQPDQGLANDILNTAWENGVRTLDTAQAYGNSEEIIGGFLKANPQCPFKIITKLTPDIGLATPEAIQATVNSSLQRLGVAPSGLLLHSGSLLEAWNGPLGETLSNIKRRGEIGEIGVSVYEPEEFKLAMEIPEITMIQAPFNVLDRRLIDGGLLKRAVELKKKVFLRSVYLQGLLLLTPTDLPPAMTFATKPIERWRKICEKYALSSIQASLQFVRAAAPYTQIVIGCETAKQLREVVQYINGPGLNSDMLADIAALPLSPSRLLNPSQWGADHL
jgi:aryl-alcohol dehydrogenase-like predicted oxidoreductase